MTETVVITGITGQDGSLMADYLLENTDVNIVGVVRCLSVENHDNIEHLKSHPRVSLVEGDISDPHSMTGIVSKLRPQYFINFAANSFVGTSWEMPAQVFEANTNSVIHQLEAIRLHSRNTRYYQAGSSEEFGDVQYLPQDEKHPLRPRSPYGASKSAARHIVKVYRESYGLYAVAGWLFNHESHRRGEKFVTRKITKGVARILKAIKAHLEQRQKGADSALEFAPIELGNLDAKRDWSYAGDFMDGVWRMLNQDRFNPEILLNLGYAPDTHAFIQENIKDYVLSSGETHSIREFIEAAFTAAGINWVNVNPEKTPPAEGKGFQINYQLPSGHPLVVINPKFYRPAEVDVLLGDSTLARKELGWKPKLTFTDLVSKMVENDISLTQI